MEQQPIARDLPVEEPEPLPLFVGQRMGGEIPSENIRITSLQGGFVEFVVQSFTGVPPGGTPSEDRTEELPEKTFREKFLPDTNGAARR